MTILLNRIFVLIVILQIGPNLIQCRKETAFRRMFPKSVPIKPGRDYGDPLFLTPLIQQGKLDEARRLSTVGPLEGTNVTSHTGFLTVNSEYNSNMFFWFFPSLNNYENAPVVLWLQGGPGGSSLFGLFAEHGPFFVGKDLILHDRNYTWASISNLLYIDNPVGTGFSFTQSPHGYVKNESQVAQDLYEALQQFFTIFAELRANKFYLTGESYAGKYVPAIGYKIHMANPTATDKINLAGLAIGDGLIDPITMLDYGDFLFSIGLIEERQRRQFMEFKSECETYIANGQYREAANVFFQMIDSPKSYFYNCTGLSDPYNYLRTFTPTDQDIYTVYLSKQNVRRAIHVGNLTFNDGIEVQYNLQDDIARSTKSWLETLLDNDYKVMIYNGQLDIIIAYPLTKSFVDSMNWKHADAYKSAERIIWKVRENDKQVAGYVRRAFNFYEVLVRNAGHILPYDQPRFAFDMFARFILDKNFHNGN